MSLRTPNFKQNKGIVFICNFITDFSNIHKSTSEQLALGDSGNGQVNLPQQQKGSLSTSWFRLDIKITVEKFCHINKNI